MTTHKLGERVRTCGENPEVRFLRLTRNRVLVDGHHDRKCLRPGDLPAMLVDLLPHGRRQVPLAIEGDGEKLGLITEEQLVLPRRSRSLRAIAFEGLQGAEEQQTETLPLSADDAQTPAFDLESGDVDADQLMFR